MMTLSFDQGTLLITGEEPPPLAGVVFDERTRQWRAPAYLYRDLVTSLLEESIPYKDEARAYEPKSLKLLQPISPRVHQKEALDAWMAAGSKGVVSLPTGAGKTYLAILAIRAMQRPVLVIVPTIHLLEQWRRQLATYFGEPVGAMGGGHKQWESVCVSTFDSAAMGMESWGNRFGLLVVDECHHLPAPFYQLIARATLAPYRLGLSATVERVDGGEEIIYDLLGDKVYEAGIHEMVGKVLSTYDVVSVEVSLTPEEEKRYLAARGEYLGFVRFHGIRMGSPQGWQEFIRVSASRGEQGRRAMAAYREQKKLAQGSESKLLKLWELLQRHPGERVLIFTDDNALAYRIGRRFFLPVLTHQTKPKERSSFLEKFRTGEYPVLATSKVLNEGVDVPEASIAIIVSGSAGVREHVQRLGRILRQKPGKRAILYEIISQNTAEGNVKDRRRQHSAYQRSPALH